MAAYTRSNPTAPALGVLQSTLQLKAFKVNPSVAFDATTAQAFAAEMGTTGALIQAKSDGDYAIIVGDGHALDVNIIALRVGRVHTGGEGTLTSSGVFTNTSSSATVTVTELTSLFAV